jgi:hypothetical protein
MGCERFGDPGMQLPSRPAQQGAVGRILDQGVLEQVRGLRRHSALKDQAGIDEALERLLEPLCGELADRRCQLIGEFTADRGADLGAPLAAGPSRSSRAISDACNVAGTPSPAPGTDAAISRPRSAPASSTALVISSTKSGTPSVRSTISAITSGGSKAALPARRSTRTVAPPEPVQRDYRDMRLPRPGRLELGTEGGDQQDRQAVDPRDNEVEQLPRSRIDPMQILEDHQYRVRSGQLFELSQQRRKGVLLFALRAQLEWRETVGAGQRQQLDEQGDVADLGGRPKQRRQLVEFCLGPVVARKTSGAFE